MSRPTWRNPNDDRAGVIASLLPTLVELGIATEEEVGIETLAARLRDEAVALGATVMAPPLISAWARKPEDAPAGSVGSSPRRRP
jgi:hypothetical protein